MNECDAVLERLVRGGDAAGVVAVAVDTSGVRYLGSAGWQDREAEVEMAPDAVFTIASMTKAITSVAAMQCVERGALTLDEPIRAVLPALGEAPVLEGYAPDGTPTLRPPRRPITLRHLLTHTSGLGYTTWNAALFEYRRRHPRARPMNGPDLRRSAPLVHDPGERWEYGTSTDFVGLAVEAVTGQKLGKYFEEHIFAPLGMSETAFEVPRTLRPRLATRYLRQPDGSLLPEPPADPPPAAFQSGGGGLFSTASDYARFLGALLNAGAGVHGGGRILQPETVRAMGESQIGSLIAGQMPSSEPDRSYDAAFLAGSDPGWALGFLTNGKPVPGGRQAGSLSWGGLYNTYFWLDPRSGVGGAMFTQVLPFADPRVLARFEDFERAVYAQRHAYG